jgi:23S rRNA-intervening sequence protein
MGMGELEALGAAYSPDDGLMTTQSSMVHMTTDAHKPASTGDLKELVAWHVAMDFAEATYRSTARFPDDEKFGLRMQLRRAVGSVASNKALSGLIRRLRRSWDHAHSHSHFLFRIWGIQSRRPAVISRAPL